MILFLKCEYYGLFDIFVFLFARDIVHTLVSTTSHLVCIRTYCSYIKANQYSSCALGVVHIPVARNNHHALTITQRSWSDYLTVSHIHNTLASIRQSKWQDFQTFELTKSLNIHSIPTDKMSEEYDPHTEVDKDGNLRFNPYAVRFSSSPEPDADHAAGSPIQIITTSPEPDITFEDYMRGFPAQIPGHAAESPGYADSDDDATISVVFSSPATENTAQSPVFPGPATSPASASRNAEGSNSRRRLENSHGHTSPHTPKQVQSNASPSLRTIASGSPGNRIRNADAYWEDWELAFLVLIGDWVTVHDSVAIMWTLSAQILTKITALALQKRSDLSSPRRLSREPPYSEGACERAWRMLKDGLHNRDSKIDLDAIWSHLGWIMAMLEKDPLWATFALCVHVNHHDPAKAFLHSPLIPQPLPPGRRSTRSTEARLQLLRDRHTQAVQDNFTYVNRCSECRQCQNEYFRSTGHALLRKNDDLARRITPPRPLPDGSYDPPWLFGAGVALPGGRFT